MQTTLKESIIIKGIGLHSGCEAIMILEPAPADFGIQFLRSDVKDAMPIRGLYSNIVDTRNCTCLGTSKENIISTIEHLMSVLYIIGLDNALVKINNPEIPILDGSALGFWELLKNVEFVKSDKPKKYLEVLKEVSFEDDKGAGVKLLPSKTLDIHLEIDFPSKIVGHQVFDATIDKEIFTKDIAMCRTFCEKYQVDYLKSVGLIKGGSLENAVVLDGDSILNPEGLRHTKECVNHKVLDAIGDLYTSGYYILAKVVANKSGHYHNNEVLKKLFSSSDNYRIITKED